MKLKVFTVFDSKAETFARPFFMKTVGEAIRSWVDVVNDSTTAFSKHPQDFVLYEVASYDDANGQFENIIPPVSHGAAAEYVSIRTASDAAAVRHNPEARQ